MLDSAVLDDAHFTPILNANREVARVHVEDGVHRIETESGKSGLGRIVINPIPVI